MFRSDCDCEILGMGSLNWNSLKNYISYIPFYDAYALKQRRSDYILSEGYQRSKETGVGIIDPLPLGNILRRIPIVSWAAGYFFPRIYVFSGTRNNLDAVASYGEKIDDKRAREPHDRVKHATGAVTIVNQVGAGAAMQKKNISKSLSSKGAFECAKELGANIAAFWADEKSLQDNITYIGAIIIGRCFLGIQDFPREYVPLLREANDLIADGDATSIDFSRMRNNIQGMSDAILARDPQKIINSNAYVSSLFKLTGDETDEQAAEKLKASHGGDGFIVESNLSFIIMIALAHISTTPHILQNLMNEIQNYNEKADDDINSEDLKNFEYLDCIYRETLRFASPTAVVPRVTSVNSTMEIENKKGEKSNCTIFPNSFLFFSIRSIHHDPDLWENPELFNPERFRQAVKEKKLHFIGENYFPFSAGKRACPAGNSFVEYAFKGFLIEFFKKYKLVINQELENISASAVHPRWKNEYFAQLRPVYNSLCRDKNP